MIYPWTATTSSSSPLASTNQSPGHSAHGLGLGTQGQAQGQGLANESEAANGHTVTAANGQPINGISPTGEKERKEGRKEGRKEEGWSDLP